MNNTMLNNINNDEKIEQLVDLEEDVTVAGAEPTQLTGKEAGRVLGFGCRD